MSPVWVRQKAYGSKTDNRWKNIKGQELSTGHAKSNSTLQALAVDIPAKEASF